MIQFRNPAIYTATLFPVGKNNMESLNRFVGAHKRYSSPTEFGTKGEVSRLDLGRFSMDQHGVLLTPRDYGLSAFLHANISKYHKPEELYGFSLYKSGLAILGIELDELLSVNELKQGTASLSYMICDTIFPILNEGQQTLLYSVLQLNDPSEIRYKLKPYSLICCETSPFHISDPEELLSQHSADIEALTDWVISCHTLSGGILFIGMAAMLYIGSRDRESDLTLRHILYLQACNKYSHYLHSLLWSVRKQLQNLKESSKRANYKVLKKNNEHICALQGLLANTSVFDDLLGKETEEIAERWQAHTHIKRELQSIIRDKFSDELLKSGERKTTIHQLDRELDVLSSELENRLELIMTRDTMTLNIILLVLTIVSVLGIGEVVGFTVTQWILVALVLVPFGAVSVWYLRNFLKNFRR